MSATSTPLRHAWYDDALAFATGAYQFTRYRKSEPSKVRLTVPEGVDGDELSRIAEGVGLTRDLINTPSNDMGPEELEAAARTLAKLHDARIDVIAGDRLVKEFPLIHAVGMGSPRAPRLIEMARVDVSARRVGRRSVLMGSAQTRGLAGHAKGVASRRGRRARPITPRRASRGFGTTSRASGFSISGRRADQVRTMSPIRRSRSGPVSACGSSSQRTPTHFFASTT